jgi:hypothetical protein
MSKKLKSLSYLILSYTSFPRIDIIKGTGTRDNHNLKKMILKLSMQLIHLTLHRTLHRTLYRTLYRTLHITTNLW